MRTEHILIMRFSAMGDVAMTVPVVYVLARQYPHVRITMLSRPFARPFFEHMPHNVSFMEADVKREYDGIKGLNALYRRLMAKNFTAVADLHSVLRSDYLRMRFNIDRFRVEHIDKHREGRRQLVKKENKKLVQQPTAFENYADVFRRLGYPIELEGFKSIFGDAGSDQSLLPDNLHRHTDSTEPWIGIAPFAAFPSKVYFPRLMERAIEMIEQMRPGCRILFFGGGKEETETFARWCYGHPNRTDASGQLHSLRLELILMNRLDVMVSMDSSNMHLASIAGTPVVSIWGGTHPYAGFMGWGQSPDNAIQVDMPCRPCSIFGNKECQFADRRCLRLIHPGQVAEKVDAILAKKYGATKHPLPHADAAGNAV